jgi:hypothetical protein
MKVKISTFFDKTFTLIFFIIKREMQDQDELLSERLHYLIRKYSTYETAKEKGWEDARMEIMALIRDNDVKTYCEDDVQSLFIVVLEHNDEELLDFLLEYKRIDLKGRFNVNQIPTFYAVKSVKMLKKLVSKEGFDITLGKDDGHPSIIHYKYCKERKTLSPELLQYCLDKGVNPRLFYKREKRSLFHIIFKLDEEDKDLDENEEIDKLKILLTFIKDDMSILNSANRSGSTPLDILSISLVCIRHKEEESTIRIISMLNTMKRLLKENGACNSHQNDVDEKDMQIWQNASPFRASFSFLPFQAFFDSSPYIPWLTPSSNLEICVKTMIMKSEINTINKDLKTSLALLYENLKEAESTKSDDLEIVKWIKVLKEYERLLLEHGAVIVVNKEEEEEKNDV